jgi:predicted metal-dependent phosphoesterase TrpH
MRIDLHTHSTASDGTDSPAQLIAEAAAAGIDVIAITDHDTTAGWSEALRARPRGLTVVPGVEFSCIYRGADADADADADTDTRPISLHLLAYLVDPADPHIDAEWMRLRDTRVDRARRMVDALASDGYPIDWEQVAELADGGAVGRPHIGRALVDSGVVPDVDTAFRDLLSSRQRYYVRKADTDVFDALRMIQDARGLAVFAHPFARRRGPVVSEQAVADFAAAGLVGIEVEHPDHDADDRAQARRLAGELGLIGTGSSDYHGDNKRNRVGQCLTDPEAYERLVAHPTALRPVGD